MIALFPTADALHKPQRDSPEPHTPDPSPHDQNKDGRRGTATQRTVLTIHIDRDLLTVSK